MMALKWSTLLNSVPTSAMSSTNDEAQGNTNFDAEDVSPAGTNTWKHDQFGKTNPPNLGK